MDFLQIGLAFLEGIALIASPCILPVLPLILSASVNGGRSRPYGIISGFVVSFSAFVLLSRQLVNAFHIDLDIVKNVSLVLLFLFGLVLLSKTLSEKFSAATQGAANFGNKVAGSGEGGFFSGMVIGALIGLVWTPCAGPILAAVLVQVILQKNDVTALVTIAAFAIGAGVPMLVIALVGRKVMGKLGFFTAHAETIRKVFGVIIILTVLYIAFGAKIVPMADVGAAEGDATSLQKGLEKPYPAPEFSGINAWLNSKPLTMKGLKGKVVLVDFWTYSCINCVRTLPYITDWDNKYRDKGLVIVGVHAPEFEFEKNEDNVKTALTAHGIKYPVAMDNELATWQNFNNQYWPAHYLINQSGDVVYTHFGEGDYGVTENNIRYLLGIKGAAQAVKPVAQNSDAEITPETYLGYARAKNYYGASVIKDKEGKYFYPYSLSSLPGNNWILQGGWKVEGQKITSGEAGSSLLLKFHARKVFLVMGTAGGNAVDVDVTLNSDEARKITVVAHTLYELVDQQQAKDGVLEIKAESPGLEAYAFTFGD